MAGFCLTRHPDSSAAPLTQGGWSLESATPGDEIYQASTEEGAVVLDGYAHGLSQHDLARALAACDEQLLAGLDGHFAALVMGEDGTLRGHSDRLGSRTLYVRDTPV